MAKTYHVGLVGESRYQDAIGKLREGERVFLVPEPENPYDPRAISARDGNGNTIGYLPQDHWLGEPLIDQGKGSRALVDSINGGDAERPSLGVVLTVELGEKGAPVATAVAPTSAAVATPGEKAARKSRLDAALGPDPDAPVDKPKPKLGKGCLIAIAILVGLIILGSLLPEPAPPTAEEKAKAAAEETAKAADAKGEVKRWYRDMIAAAGPCDDASKTFAAAAEKASPGNTLTAYQSAKIAERACLDSFGKVGQVTHPAGVSTKVADLADTAEENCTYAFSDKKTAMTRAAEIYDGEMSNSAVTEFGELSRAAQRSQMACVAAILQTANEAGVDVAKLQAG